MTPSAYINKQTGTVVILLDVPLHIISMFQKELKKRGLSAATFDESAMTKFKWVAK